MIDPRTVDPRCLGVTRIAWLGGPARGELVGEVPLACTATVPTMNGCTSHLNLYVPGVLNVHVPLHPAPVG